MVPWARRLRRSVNEIGWPTRMLTCKEGWGDGVFGVGGWVTAICDGVAIDAVAIIVRNQNTENNRMW